VERAVLELMFERFQAAGEKPALLGPGFSISYRELLAAVDAAAVRLAAAGVRSGDIVMLHGDYSPEAISALLALLDAGAIVVPVAPTSEEKAGVFAEVAGAQWSLTCGDGDIRRLSGSGLHALYDQLRRHGEAGIIIFSSGTTGAPRGAVHSAHRLLEKFRKPGKDLRTLAFLLFDHIAGLDTLFYALSNTSALVLAESRAPDAVAAAIEAHRAEVLPTAPSFLNLLLLSGAHERRDLSSLKIITYGSEMMPLPTLERCVAAFPNAQLVQKYGTSEFGALPGRSRSNTSTWIRLGGEGFAWRERNGCFEVKAKTAMLGYLNAPSPFTDDGFLMTGDRIEVDGEYVRFLGRESDIINVGGQKVFPAEIEGLLAAMPEIADVSVFGEPHPILGSVVVARVRPKAEPFEAAELRRAIRAYLSGRVEAFKIPQKLLFTSDPLSTDRFKQVRRQA
jgi:long-chain acyl-CoA synthetase